MSGCVSRMCRVRYTARTKMYRCVCLTRRPERVYTGRSHLGRLVPNGSPSVSSGLCHFSWLLQIHAGRFESVNRNSFILSFNVHYESFRTCLDDLEWTLVRSLERCTMSTRRMNTYLVCCRLRGTEEDTMPC